MFGKLPEKKKQLIYRHLHAIRIFCANKIASRFSELVGGLPLPQPPLLLVSCTRFTEIVGQSQA